MHVRVVLYRPEWPLLFAQEAEKIGKAFGAELLAVHHIGSTSVEGLAAKPIIDILLYGNLKQHLAQQFPEDIERYCDGKDAFVKALEKRAYAWYFTK